MISFRIYFDTVGKTLLYILIIQILSLTYSRVGCAFSSSPLIRVLMDATLLLSVAGFIGLYTGDLVGVFLCIGSRYRVRAVANISVPLKPGVGPEYFIFIGCPFRFTDFSQFNRNRRSEDASRFLNNRNVFAGTIGSHLVRWHRNDPTRL